MKKALIIILILTGCGHSRPWTTGEKVLLGASVLASYADYRTTTNVLDNGGYEMNPLIGKHPSKERLALFLISSEVITIALAHYFPRYRKFLLGGKTAINTGCAIHNSQVGD